MKYKLLTYCLLLLLTSCSTTRLLKEGEYRLASNEVEVISKNQDKDERRLPRELDSYIRQDANKDLIFGWNPLLNVYNWSNGSGGGINGFWEKIGVAPVVFSPLLVESSVDNMKSRLSYLGYYNAEVKPEILLKNKLAKVTYNVTPGKRYSIDEIRYELPPGEFQDEFLADSLNMGVKVGDYLSEQLLEAESVRGASYFRNLGYYDFNKNAYSFEADTLKGKTVLYYRISADPSKYTIRNVSIQHPSDIKFRESLLRQFNTIKPGDYYSEDLVNKTYYRFSALNLFSGVNIQMTPVDSTHVDCDIKLTGSNLMGFKANLEASTNSSALFGISPQLSFFHKNLFHGGEWLNLDFTGNWQFMPGSDLGATELGASASLSLPKMLGYPPSKIKGKNIPRTEFKASFSYQNRPEYRRSVAGFSYGFTGQLGTKYFYQVSPLQLSLVELYDISDGFSKTLQENPYLWDSFEDLVDLGLGGTIYYTSDASVVPKGSYEFARFSLDLSGNALSIFDKWLPIDGATGKHHFLGLPYKQYVKAAVSAGTTARFGRNNGHALAVRVEAGIGKAYGNSTAMPFEKQFYAGGASSMRGWQVRTLGPGFNKMDDSFIIPSQTGDLKLEMDIEYRFNMFWKLEGALFAEAGNIWLLNEIKRFEDIGPESIAADWGLGLRFNLDFILLRFDMGFKVHDPARPDGSRWLTPRQWFAPDGSAFHFGVGYPF